MSVLYKNIQRFMELKGFKSLNMLSKVSGVNYASLNDLKSGKQSTLGYKNLVKLASCFEVTVDDLVFEKKEKEPSETDDPLTKELIEKIMQLSKENSMKAMDFVDYLLASGHNQEP